MTLAGLLAWNGVVLLLIGDKGTVIIQNSVVVGFANDFLPAATAWIVLVAGVALYAGILMVGDRTRRKAGLPTEPIALLRAAGRRPRRSRAPSSSGSPTRTAASRTCSS